MSLSSRSMLVSLSQKMWWSHAADRHLGAQSEMANEAENRSFRVVKKLVPSEYILPIKRVAIYGRDQHERLTLPGIQRGQQLLATKLFDEYAVAQSEIKDTFFAEVKRFVDIYPSIIEAAPARLGKAFRPEDFPSADKIMSYFDYSIRVSPVPDSGNWLLEDVDIEDMDKMRNEINNEQNRMVRDASKHLVERMNSVLENLHSQAKAYKEGVSSGGLLRDVTINAVKDLAYLAPSMNLSNDPILAAAAQDMIKSFETLDAKDMRKDASARSNVAEQAARIMKRLRAAQ